MTLSQITFYSLGNISTCTTLRQYYKLYSAASAYTTFGETAFS